MKQRLQELLAHFSAFARARWKKLSLQMLCSFSELVCSCTARFTVSNEISIFDQLLGYEERRLTAGRTEVRS